MRRFYTPKNRIFANKVRLSPEETHHLLCVDRFKPGDKVLVFDGEGLEYEAVVNNIKDKRATLEIKKKTKAQEKNYFLRVGICLPKRSKFEDIIEKCTELNVDEIIPLISERTVVKIDRSKMEAKLKRWQKKSIEASKQSKRIKLPKITQPRQFKEFLEEIVKRDTFLLIPSLYTGKPIKDTLKTIKNHKDITVLIGPEGGFSLAEVKLAEEKKAALVSLGGTVLRVETAVIFVVSILNYELGD